MTDAATIEKVDAKTIAAYLAHLDELSVKLWGVPIAEEHKQRIRQRFTK